MDKTNSENTVQVTGTGIESVMASEKKKKPPLRLFALVAAGVLFIGCIVALITGYMTVIVKMPAQRVLVLSPVCDDSVVDEFNSILDSYYFGEGSRSEAVEAANALVTDFSKKANYKADATCIFIAYKVAYLKGDSTTAQQAVDTLKELVATGRFVDTRVSGLVNIESMSESVGIITPGNEE